MPHGGNDDADGHDDGGDDGHDDDDGGGGDDDDDDACPRRYHTNKICIQYNTDVKRCDFGARAQRNESV